MHPDNSEEGSKKITNAIKVELENLKNSTQEANAQNLQQKISPLETKLAHSKEYPVVEVKEKVKHTETRPGDLVMADQFE